MLGPRAPRTTCFTPARELECVDLAALLEPGAEGLEHLLAPVADPLSAQSLPGDVGIEQRGRRVEVASAKSAEEVGHHSLEVLLADA